MICREKAAYVSKEAGQTFFRLCGPGYTERIQQSWGDAGLPNFLFGRRWVLFYYRPLFLETQGEIYNFLREKYYATILCKSYYVNLLNFEDRWNEKIHDIVAE